ncbi:MAG: hypothetical protein Q9227_007205 [Pyrenula ochraceoflavens]
MSPTDDPSQLSNCTTCTFSEDFSNYWTAVLYFRAPNNTLMRVPQRGNVGMEQANGGLTVYYIPPYDDSPVTAFPKGFRMAVGNPTLRSPQASAQTDPSGINEPTYTCLQDLSTRSGEAKTMPTAPCAAGVMSSIRFPTCWDGQNLDSTDHISHMAYPTTGTFENNGPCPSTHPVKTAQVLFEVVWDTRAFNDPSLWPTDGSQPFVWSYGESETGYGYHADYLFGWKGDALQRGLDANRYSLNYSALATQDIATANGCTKPPLIMEDTSRWTTTLPGNINITAGTN